MYKYHFDIAAGFCVSFMYVYISIYIYIIEQCSVLNRHNAHCKVRNQLFMFSNFCDLVYVFTSQIKSFKILYKFLLILHYLKYLFVFKCFESSPDSYFILYWSPVLQHNTSPGAQETHYESHSFVVDKINNNQIKLSLSLTSLCN